MIKPIEETRKNTQPAKIYCGYPYTGKYIPKTAKKRLATKSDLTGKKYGRLTVIEDLGALPNGWRLWGCLCKCGRKKAVRSRELYRGHTNSCGCLWYENIISRAGMNKMKNGESAFNCLLGSYKRSARLRKYSWELTRDEFKELTSQNCYYCGQEPSNVVYERKGYTNGGYKSNGVDRIDNTKGYVVGNVRPCCKQCNLAKNTLNEDEFYRWIANAAMQARFEFGELG